MKYFESVATDIYYQEKHVLYEVPDDVDVSMDEFSIRVSSADANIMGSITATVEEGELVIEHSSGDSDHLIISILCGILISLALTLVIVLIFGVIGLI